MKDFLTVDHIIEEKVYMDGIPSIILKHKNSSDLIPTIIFYHGWSSSKEKQRLRGFILANLGYQVIIPDSIHHGERGRLDYNNPKNGRDFFWPVIFKNIEESNTIIHSAIKNYNTDPKNIAVMGNSMGGFTSAGIFTHNKEIKSLVVLNGSCNWSHSNNIFKEYLGIGIGDELIHIEEKINELDPMNNMELLIDRSILMLHGDKDTVVPISSQKLFYEKIKPVYKNSNHINFIVYPNLNHFVTTNMMEESAKWFKSYL